MFDKDLAMKDREEVKEKPEGWITETLKKACEGSENQLTSVKDKNYTIIVEGDDSTRLEYYEEKRIVSITRAKMVNRTSNFTFSQIAKTKAEGIKIGSSEETGPEWKELRVVANDHRSIHWMINVIEKKKLTDTLAYSEVEAKLSSMKYCNLGNEGRFKEVERLAVRTKTQMMVMRRGSELIHISGSSDKWLIIHLEDQDIYIFKKRINGGSKGWKGNYQSECTWKNI